MISNVKTSGRMWNPSNHFIVVGVRLHVFLPDSSTTCTVTLQNNSQTRGEIFTDCNTRETSAHIRPDVFMFEIMALRLLLSNIDSRLNYFNTPTRWSSLPYVNHFVSSTSAECTAALCCIFRGVISCQYLEAWCNVTLGLTCLPQSLHWG